MVDILLEFALLTLIDFNHLKHALALMELHIKLAGPHGLLSLFELELVLRFLIKAYDCFFVQHSLHLRSQLSFVSRQGFAVPQAF